MLQFPPDITLVIQLVTFFVLFLILNKLLFAPFAQVLSEREQRTGGAEDSAEEAEADAERIREIAELLLARLDDADPVPRKQGARGIGALVPLCQNVIKILSNFSKIFTDFCIQI